MLKLKEKYQKEVVPKMKEKYGFKNDMAVPRIEKVVINTGIGRFAGDEKIKEGFSHDLSLICGQRPVFRQAKKAISAFKIRKGMTIGISATLRRQLMYDFLDRFIHIDLPRSRDFRGLPLKSIDKNGNFCIGIKEQIIFPEISAESARNIFGLEICIKTNTKDRQQAIEMFKLMGFPLQHSK